MKKIYLLVSLLLLSLSGIAQTTAWSPSPPVVSQTRKFNNQNQVRFIWGTSGLFNLPDSLASIQTQLNGKISTASIASDTTAEMAVFAIARGDSFTQGNGRRSFPARLSYVSGIGVSNRGKGGTTAEQIRNTFLTEKSTWNIPHIMIGVGRNNLKLLAHEADSVRNCIKTMIDSMARRSNTRFLLGSIFPAAVAAEVLGMPIRDTLNAINSWMASTYPTHYVDLLTPILEFRRSHPTHQDTIDFTNGWTPNWLRLQNGVTDSLHMNSYGYSIMANTAYNSPAWANFADVKDSVLTTKAARFLFKKRFGNIPVSGIMFGANNGDWRTDSLHMVYDTAATHPVFTRDLTANNIVQTSLELIAKTRTTIADGMGTSVLFRVADTSYHIHNIGYIGFSRRTDDSTGRYVVNNYKNGVANQFVTGDINGRQMFGTAGTSTDPDAQLELRSTAAQLGLSYGISKKDTMFVDINGNLIFGGGTGKLGLNGVTPVYTLNLPSTSNGWGYFNTSDQNTNFEVFRSQWVSNVLNLETFAGGTGVLRKLNLNGGGGLQLQHNGVTRLQTQASGITGLLNVPQSSSGAGNTLFGFSGTLSNTSGNDNIIGLFNIISQSGGATFNGIYQSLFINSHGTNPNYFAKWATSSAGSGTGIDTVKYSVDTKGNVTAAGTINNLTITVPATAATLTIANNKTLAVTNSLTFSGTDATVLTGPNTSGSLVVGGTITWPGTIYTSPTTGTVSAAGVLNYSPTLATQTANRVFAGPTSGGASTPAFRALVAADMPTTLNATTFADVTISSLAASFPVSTDGSKKLVSSAITGTFGTYVMQNAATLIGLSSASTFNTGAAATPLLDSVLLHEGNKLVTAPISNFALSSTSAIHGNSTTTGTATTAVTVTIGSTLANSSYVVSITPRDLLTAVNYYISAQSTTQFTVTFISALTGSINFDYVINQ